MSDQGERILAALNDGRQRAIDQAQQYAAVVERAVRQELDLDILAGHAKWGRASRIANRLRGKVTVFHHGEEKHTISARHINRILHTLSVCPIYSTIVPPNSNGSSKLEDN